MATAASTSHYCLEDSDLKLQCKPKGKLSHLQSVPVGDIMISAMGTPEGDGKGGFVLLDQEFKVKSPSRYICNISALQEGMA